MSRISLSIILLFLLVVLTASLGWFTDTGPRPKQTREDYLRPNYEASRMQTRLYDASGQLTHRIDAQKMEHYDALGFTLFQQPDYWLYDGQLTQPWHIQAEQATLHSDQRLQLDGQVDVTNAAEDSFVRRIETEFMQIDLKDKLMHSDQPVLISGESYQIKSNGMSGDIRDKAFELLDHVQTQYDTQP
ncbi:hypothetical protein HMF8227_02508 [Saliniradius amylolyticus]|uniref:Lipopolysaccharide export system protein LptC n=1 Tax=Saliniradius amylolyticus TaxID=2183582 RepID=A0A2S2E6U4_9ALTE|nr:LPS export ABC transporter periplasmic protein LptC [Saliniradius amylolyticus]AWL12960.1 hypothetical protein HMF8227_02508 [Saliniradius amylolyticus]